jgi:hypothetical protein
MTTTFPTMNLVTEFQEQNLFLAPLCLVKKKTQSGYLSFVKK